VGGSLHHRLALGEVRGEIDCIHEGTTTADGRTVARHHPATPALALHHIFDKTDDHEELRSGAHAHVCDSGIPTSYVPYPVRYIGQL